MVAARAPWWLATPSRWAGLKRSQACIALALVAALVVIAWTSPFTHGPSLVTHQVEATETADADVTLYQGIVAAMRSGAEYYLATADALRVGGYPLRPFVTFRLPTLATVEALLPLSVMPVLLWLLAGATFLAWAIRVTPALSRLAPRLFALALLAGGMLAFVQSDLVYLHEIWAGLLIALSLATRAPGRWIEALALGASAVLIRETAALYLAVMAGAAWIDGERREAAGWVAVALALAAIIALHAWAVSLVVQSGDPSSPGWHGHLGPGFFVRTMSVSTVLALLPLWLAAPFVALAFVGWASWRDPLATRALALFVVYALLLSLFGRPDTFYWGLLVAPTLLVGLVFVPDGLRDLIRAALDRRRITVTRIAR